MVTVNRAQVKARLSEIPDRVEAGEEVIVTRRGKAVVHLAPAVGPPKPLPLRDPVGFRAAMPPLQSGAAGLLRAARDQGL